MTNNSKVGRTLLKVLGTVSILFFFCVLLFAIAAIFARASDTRDSAFSMFSDILIGVVAGVIGIIPSTLVIISALKKKSLKLAIAGAITAGVIFAFYFPLISQIFMGSKARWTAFGITTLFTSFLAIITAETAAVIFAAIGKRKFATPITPAPPPKLPDIPPGPPTCFLP